MVVVHLADTEAHAQVRRAFLVGHFFCPVVFFPVVTWHIEQASILAVSHWVPVFAAEEGGRNLNGFTTGLSGCWLRWTLAFHFDWATGFRVDALGPGDVVDKWEATNKAAVFTIDHVEEAVTVSVSRCLDGLAFFLVFKQHQFVVAGEIPGIVWCVLVEPLYFTGGWVNTNLTGGVEAVEVFGIATFSRPCPTIPWRRVTCADNDGVGLNVVAGALPWCAATVAPGFNLAGW